MGNLQLQGKSYKAQVLRLKELLDRLRGLVRSILPANPTSRDVGKALGVKTVHAQRFWEEGISGGKLTINAIKAKIGQDGICNEVLDLLDAVPDIHKSLVAYPLGAIELTFDITDAFIAASHQVGVVKRGQMRGEQFAAFFGSHREFVHATVVQRRQVLKDYNEELDSKIRAVLQAHDWTKVRPDETVAIKASASGSKSQQLAAIISEIRPKFASENALLEALPAHQDSLRNALAGKGKEHVLDQLLRKARRLRDKLKSAEEKTKPAQLVSQETVTGPEATTRIGAFVAMINSAVRMGENLGVDSSSFTDGDRDDLVFAIGKLVARAGINETTFNRLQSREGLDQNHPVLVKVLSAFVRGVKKR